MNVFLLYPDKEWVNTGKYFDTGSIQKNLDLQTIYSAAGKDLSTDKNASSDDKKADQYLIDTMSKVTMVPLETKEEIVYRQDIIRDFMSRERMIFRLYEIVSQMMKKWDDLGRKTNGNKHGSNPAIILGNEIQIMKLFVDTYKEIKVLFAEYDERISSQGLNSFYNRLCNEFPTEFFENMYQLLEDLSFYVDVSDRDPERMNPTVNLPEIIIECGLGDGLKLSSIRLEKVGTTVTAYRNPYGLLSTVQDYVTTRSSSTISIYKNAALQDQIEDLEYQVVSYVMDCCAPFRDSSKRFFDQLYVQAAFYCGAIKICSNMRRFRLPIVIPKVIERGQFHFTDLKELSMAMTQDTEVIGNTLDLDDKSLLIITGANQGGKSTFLRSIGIAQIMMQSGLFVAANKYESGIYPGFFTHFTRREDSSMNSGRLDEELKRMSQIIDHVDESSLLLLNESFASTTEIEGSDIAYDIIKALYEKNITILTVTHLLSFAQKIFDEKQKNQNMKIDFLSAERLPDGKRTYKMIAHSPELTSFGLDLYNEIVEG